MTPLKKIRKKERKKRKLKKRKLKKGKERKEKERKNPWIEGNFPLHFLPLKQEKESALIGTHPKTEHSLL